MTKNALFLDAKSALVSFPISRAVMIPSLYDDSVCLGVVKGYSTNCMGELTLKIAVIFPKERSDNYAEFHPKNVTPL
jgi:hypothetical protein